MKRQLKKQEETNMRNDEKRLFEDQQRVEEFLRNAHLAVQQHGEVEYFTQGEYEFLKIKKGDQSIARKEHTVPEYFIKDGD